MYVAYTESDEESAFCVIVRVRDLSAWCASSHALVPARHMSTDRGAQIDGADRVRVPLPSVAFYYTWAPDSSRVALLRSLDATIALEAITLAPTAPALAHNRVRAASRRCMQFRSV